MSLNPNGLISFAGALFSATLGVLAILRPPRTLARWTFAAGMVFLALEAVFAGLTATTLLQEPMRYWLDWRICTMSCLPGVWLLFSVSYSRGNARDFLVKWRWLLVGAFVVPVGLAVLFRRKLINTLTLAESGGRELLGLGPTGLVLHLLFLVSTVLVLMNLERTFRASVGTLRWRIKYMVMGLGLLFAVRAYTSSQAVLFRSINPTLQAFDSAALVVACVLILLALQRAGYFDVDVYPSQSLLHNSLTVLLAGVYLLIVGVFAKVVTFLGGDAAFAAKAFLILVALVLLTILLLSDRVRLHTRHFISRHFQRPLYDYRSVWRSFTESTTSRVEQTDLCRAVVKLVSDFFQVLSVTIWLFDHERKNLLFGASTSLPEARSGNLRPSASDAAGVIAGILQHPEPVDIDSSTETWAAALRRCTPDEFQKGGNRVCVPMIAGGELLGVMTLGDRVAGVRFSVQDMDLLKCIGDQTAASLLNIQLAQRLMRGREMEAFQTMSAFFVHDLKNTASTLSLMLQNLPVHFHDPAFRQDALRGISRTVSHINDLISRLSLLRQELKIRPVEADMNELAAGTLNGLEASPDVRLVTDFRPLPRLFVDPEQFRKVVTNLVLNAREAVARDGEVRVETSLENSWAVLQVTDNGCGMSRDFIDRSLFRPFQTTKRNGIGIGMFQSRMIVEAHRGRIEVESEPGKGTTFRVSLPLPLTAH